VESTLTRQLCKWRFSELRFEKTDCALSILFHHCLTFDWKSTSAEETIVKWDPTMSQLLPRRWKNRERLGLDLALLALCAVVLVHGIRTTADLEWTCDVDQDRDTGLAQAILDHRYGADHLYLGETIWYNPLTSIIIAILSRATSLPPYLITVRAGAYLNLLAPIAFYFLIAYLFDRRIAIAGTAAFLFAPIGNAESWAAASYSPWIFGENFAQVLFYLTLAAYCKALESKRRRWYIIVGLLLGIAFLGHTAPAVILGVIMIVACMKSAIQQGKPAWQSIVSTREIKGLALTLPIAFVVSLPFTFSILFRYHLRILNSAPSNWLYPPLAIDKLPALLRDNLSWFSAIAGLGLLALVIERENKHRKTLLLTWFVICCVELGLNFLQQATSPTFRLMFVPAHHFLFYLKAIEDLLFGVGLVFICQFLSRNLISRYFGPAVTESKSNYLKYRIETILIATGIVCFLALALPAYSSRSDFTTARAYSLEMQQYKKAYIDAYHWILINTQPDDVFLSITGDFDLRIVAPAARKVVVMYAPEFSNPYVSWELRRDAAILMTGKLGSHSEDALATLVKNQVKYIITSPAAAYQLGLAYYTPDLSREFGEGEVIIYSVQTRLATF
jgi:hypothetical protein